MRSVIKQFVPIIDYSFSSTELWFVEGKSEKDFILFGLFILTSTKMKSAGIGIYILWFHLCFTTPALSDFLWAKTHKEQSQ